MIIAGRPAYRRSEREKEFCTLSIVSVRGQSSYRVPSMRRRRRRKRRRRRRRRRERRTRISARRKSSHEKEAN